MSKLNFLIQPHLLGCFQLKLNVESLKLVTNKKCMSVKFTQICLSVYFFYVIIFFLHFCSFLFLFYSIIL